MKTKKLSQPRKTETPAQQSNHHPTGDEIATFAYFIWKQRGCPDGHDLEDWLEAEQQLRITHEQEAIAG